MARKNLRLLVAVAALGIAVAGVVIASAWSQALLRHFEGALDKHVAAYGLEVASEGWTIQWRRAVLSATNLTLRNPESSSVLLKAPVIEVDFYPQRVLQGWQAAIYQVYVHRPEVFVQRTGEEAWNWQQHLVHGVPDKHLARFDLGRLYADVITVLVDDDGDTIRSDNGVLTMSNLRLPVDDRVPSMRTTFHARLDGGKFSLTGLANFFRWDKGEWAPAHDLRLSLEGVGEVTARRLGLPSTGELLIKTNQ